jgi:hypothetical protein
MPRKLRIQYPGAIYHVMDRGDRQEDIFLQGFVWALGRAQIPITIIGQSRTLKRHLDNLGFDP